MSYLASTASHSIPINIPSQSIIDIVLSGGSKELRLSIIPKPQGHKSVGEEGVLVTLNSQRKGDMLNLSDLSQGGPCWAALPSLLRHVWQVFETEPEQRLKEKGRWERGTGEKWWVSNWLRYLPITISTFTWHAPVQVWAGRCFLPGRLQYF